VRDALFAMSMFLLGVFLALTLMDLSMDKAILLEKAQWRCIEYMPGSADCAVYERVDK